jgi:hypothetical protein
MNRVCLVAILKDEEPFLDEWIVYHRMLGIDHFFLYDDHPDFPLRELLKPYREYVTVIDWCGMDKTFTGRSNQIKAYTHALDHYASTFDWVLYLDGDEFVVLHKHENVQDFLADFEDCSAVSLNWHVFGHNGYYDNPEGLITASLTRRMRTPGKCAKTFTRSSTIRDIGSPHCCNLKYGKHVDPNGRPFQNGLLYPGLTERACVNHYQCRSFKNWMDRVDRGDVNFKTKDSPDEQQWRLTREACLKQFVQTVALNKNEYVDKHMLKFGDFLNIYRHE